MHIEDLFGEVLLATDRGVRLYMLASEVSSDVPGSEALSEFGNGLTIAQELAGLQSDLKRLEEGWEPNSEGLREVAPILEDWGFLNAGEQLPRIVGRWIDGAAAGVAVMDGQQMSTLQVLAVDRDFTWARDRRGFYRLGTPITLHS